MRGRFDEGIQELERAQQLDPLSPMLNVQLASGYYFARRYEHAADILLKTLEHRRGLRTSSLVSRKSLWSAGRHR